VPSRSALSPGHPPAGGTTGKALHFKDIELGSFSITARGQ
jgi:hypothetical protein